MKIVLNKCEGKYSLSDKAMSLYAQLSGLDLIKETELDDPNFSCWKTNSGKIFEDVDILRWDDDLIKVVELLGKNASGEMSQLEVVDIPDDCTWWKLSSYKGLEHIIECHRKW